MAKRFTDTNKWRKGFIRGLQAPYKLLWLYIIDECDHAGIWNVEIDVASIRIGIDVNEHEAIQNFGNHIIVFDNGQKWFIPDFIEFQYGLLNPENRAHKSVLDILEKYENKGLVRSLQGRKDMDKDKDKDMVKDKEEKKEKKTNEIQVKNQDEKYFENEIPSELKTVEFLTAWHEWIDYRAAIRKSIKKTTAIKQLKKLSSLAHPAQVLNQSMENGWTGLFELKQNYRNNNNGSGKKYNVDELTQEAEARYQRVFGTSCAD